MPNFTINSYCWLFRMSDDLLKIIRHIAWWSRKHFMNTGILKNLQNTSFTTPSWLSYGMCLMIIWKKCKRCLLYLFLSYCMNQLTIEEGWCQQLGFEHLVFSLQFCLVWFEMFVFFLQLLNTHVAFFQLIAEQPDFIILLLHSPRQVFMFLLQLETIKEWTKPHSWK